MLGDIWNLLLYKPLLNVLALLVSIVPCGDVGLAIIILTLLVKIALYPFSGCLLVLIQIPIIFALYYVFYKGINFDGGLLYSFVPPPEHLNMHFLGLLDISGKSLFLAILAGVSQYFQAHFMQRPAATLEETGSVSASFAKSMRFQKLADTDPVS